MDLSEPPFWLIAVASLVLVLAACEIGHRLGQRCNEREASNFATLQASMLGLLALIISFMFSMSLARYDARRDGVLNEANAIGTTALRARLLPDPHGREVLKILREYVQIRLEVVQSDAGKVALIEAIKRSNELHGALWQHAKAVSARDPGLVPTGLFVQSLNEMIDHHSKRLAAARNRIPGAILLCLYVITAVTMGFIGYAAGPTDWRWRAPALLSGAIVVGLILLIQDLDRPTRGFVIVSQQPLVDLASDLSVNFD